MGLARPEASQRICLTGAFELVSLEHEGNLDVAELLPLYSHFGWVCVRSSGSSLGAFLAF